MISKELLYRFEEVDAKCHTKQLEAINNPAFDYAIKKFGSATALQSLSVSRITYNRLIGPYTSEWDKDHYGWKQFPEILEFYRSNGYCVVNTVPSLQQRHIFNTLIDYKFVFSYASSVYYGKPTNNLDSTHQFVQVTDMEEYAAIIDSAFEVEEDIFSFGKLMSAGRHNFHYFGITLDEKIVSVAALYVDNEIGFLFGAGTLQEYRGKGFQNQLIGHRINVAYELGCQIVFTNTAQLSGSQRNIERQGLSLAYNKLSFYKKLID